MVEDVGDSQSAHLVKMIREAVCEVVEIEGITKTTDISVDARLYGSKGFLDSLGLVNLVVELEERIEEEYGVLLAIADERAMSRRRSPFLTVNTLTDYLKELLAEASDHV